MPIPRLTFHPGPSSDVEAEGVLFVARAGEEGPVLLSAEESAEIGGLLSGMGFRAGREEFVRLPADRSGRARAVVGVGHDAGSGALALAVGSGVRRFTPGKRLVVDAGPLAEGDALLVAEAAGMGTYAFARYRSAAATDSPRAENIVVVGAPVTASARRAEARVRAVSLVKDLVNTPAADLFPSSFAEAALGFAADTELDVEVWDEQRLDDEGFGGLLAVGAGSVRPPRLVRVSHRGAGRSRLALVGKGITFDSGGLSLKPAASMAEMKYDMAGAATVLAVALAASELDLETGIDAWLCLAENMPSGSATRPGDVITVKGGRTVEVVNTDAEGRLVLADGLVAATERGADALIDVATLTGAATIALGNRHVGAMGEEALLSRVLSAAEAAREQFWPMPLPEDLRQGLDSEIADLKNANLGSKAGGMLLAGLFLREFAVREGSPPWVHLDIAAAGWNGGTPWGATGKGPTGAGVRALLTLAEDWARP